MARVPAALFVEWARRTMGDARLVELVHDAIKRRAGAESLDIDSYLKGYEADNDFKKAMRIGEKTIESERLLVSCLRKTGLSIEVDFRCPPWDRWKAGSTFVIVYGERLVDIPNVSTGMRQLAVGARDAQAIAYLTDELRSQIQIDCQVVLHPVRPGLSPDEAAKELAGLRRSRAGAIVVIGSTLVNSLSEPMAAAIIRDESGDIDYDLLPGKFQWGFLGKPSLLSDHVNDRKKEGILDRRTNRYFPRVHDDAVLPGLKAGKKTFADCGMLFMDCRKPPYLILCAGHGGCGTLGCVYALARQVEEIAARLAAGNNRFADIITVTKSKHRNTSNEIDDLSIDPDDVEFASGERMWEPSTVWMNLA